MDQELDPYYREPTTLDVSSLARPYFWVIIQLCQPLNTGSPFHLTFQLKWIPFEMEELESNDDDYEQKQIYLAAALYAHFQFLTLDKAQYCCALLYFFFQLPFQIIVE